MKRLLISLYAICLLVAAWNLDVGAISGSGGAALENKTMYCYPASADPGNMTANSPAFTYNTDSVELIAANTITTDFWIVGLGAYTSDGADDWQIKLYKGNLGSETAIATISLPRLVNATATVGTKIVIDPIKVPANSRVGFQAGNADGDSSVSASVYVDVKY